MIGKLSTRPRPCPPPAQQTRLLQTRTNRARNATKNNNRASNARTHVQRNTYVTYTHTQAHKEAPAPPTAFAPSCCCCCCSSCWCADDDGSFKCCSTLCLRFHLFCPCALVIYFCGFYVDSAPAAVVLLLLLPVFLKMFTIVSSWLSLSLCLSYIIKLDNLHACVCVCVC